LERLISNTPELEVHLVEDRRWWCRWAVALAVLRADRRW